MSEPVNGTHRARLNVTQEEARNLANLLRYAISLNTTVGLAFPTERRLASATYKAAELAALVLEGLEFDEALRKANDSWTGSLERDHQQALRLLESNRELLRQAMAGRLSQDQISEFLEVSETQFLELTRPKTARAKGGGGQPGSPPTVS